MCSTCSVRPELETTILKHAVAGDLHVQMASLSHDVQQPSGSIAAANSTAPSILDVNASHCSLKTLHYSRSPLKDFWVFLMLDAWCAVQFEDDHSAQTMQICTATFWKFMVPVMWTLSTFTIGISFLLIAPHKVSRHRILSRHFWPYHA